MLNNLFFTDGFTSGFNPDGFQTDTIKFEHETAREFNNAQQSHQSTCLEMKENVFFCKCTLADAKCLGISLLIPRQKSNPKKIPSDQRICLLNSESSETKGIVKTEEIGLEINPTLFLQQLSHNGRHLEKEVLNDVMEYVKTTNDDSFVTFPLDLPDFIPIRSCLTVNLSKGYVMLINIEDEVVNETQFRRCIQKLCEAKAEFLESFNVISNLDSQWLFIGTIFTYFGAAQCNCITCNDFFIIGNGNIAQSFKKIEAKVCDHQINWNALDHVDEFNDLLKTFAMKSLIMCK